MVFNKLLFILLALFFIQGIQCYCVYNRFTDGIGFYIHQINSGALQGAAFNKYIEAGANECCPYSVKDCSSFRTLVEFIITFNDDDISVSGNRRKLAKCTAGGALFVGGTADKYHAECVDYYSTSTDALWPFEG